MTADLTSAKAVIDLAHEVVDTATGVLAGGSIDDSQVLAYDLAHAAASVETGRAMLHYGERGDTEAAMACAFVADAVADLAAKLYGREGDWGVEPGALDDARAFVATYRDPAFLAGLAFTEGLRHLDDDFELVQDTFRRFAEDKIRPRPSTSTASTRTSPRRSSAAWPRWGASASRSRPSTAGTARGARASTSAWWWPPRSSRGAPSAWAARSSPGRRSSRGRCWRGAPRTRSSRGSPAWPAPR